VKIKLPEPIPLRYGIYSAGLAWFLHTFTVLLTGVYDGYWPWIGSSLTVLAALLLAAFVRLRWVLNRRKMRGASREAWANVTWRIKLQILANYFAIFRCHQEEALAEPLQ
jgi:hypothetical protein